MSVITLITPFASSKGPAPLSRSRGFEQISRAAQPIVASAATERRAQLQAPGYGPSVTGPR
jgi:hypothetical protein